MRAVYTSRISVRPSMSDGVIPPHTVGVSHNMCGRFAPDVPTAPQPITLPLRLPPSRTGPGPLPRTGGELERGRIKAEKLCFERAKRKKRPKDECPPGLKSEIRRSQFSQQTLPKRVRPARPNSHSNLRDAHPARPCFVFVRALSRPQSRHQLG